MVGLVDEEIGTVNGHSLLHGRLALACDAARGHDDLSASEDLIDLCRRPRYVLKRANDRVSRGRRQNRAFWCPEHAESQELGCELCTQRIRRYDDQQFLASFRNENGEHGLGFAGAGRHDNAGGRI